MEWASGEDGELPATPYYHAKYINTSCLYYPVFYVFEDESDSFYKVVSILKYSHAKRCFEAVYNNSCRIQMGMWGLAQFLTYISLLIYVIRRI